MHRIHPVVIGALLGCMISLPRTGRAQEWQNRARYRTPSADVFRTLPASERGEAETETAETTTVDLPALIGSGTRADESQRAEGDAASAASMAASSASSGAGGEAMGEDQPSPGLFARIGAFFRRLLRLFGIG